MKTIFLFPACAVLFSVVAYISPEVFAPYKKSIIPLLGLVMFGMGMSLSVQNFIDLFKRPKIIVLGLALQFMLMPLFAFLLAIVFALPREILIGLVLVGSCPGGTASNVICYLAKGDVALSILLTTASTMLAVIMTPLLTWLYIGQMIEVPFINMMKMIFSIIVMPVLIGVLLNHYLKSNLNWLRKLFPIVSMIAVILIIAIIVALNQSQLKYIVYTLSFAVILHNILGLTSAYYIATFMGYSSTNAKTLAIEVGMQNSGLAVALAAKFFPAAAALPGVIFSIWHNLSGACLASYWSTAKKTNKQ